MFSDLSRYQALLAYLDPGSGSLMLQMLIAGLLTGMFFLRSSLQMVRCTFVHMFKRHD